MPRTNNAAEAFHSKLDGRLQTCASNIYKIIELLRKTQLNTEQKMKGINDGTEEPPEQKTHFLIKEEKLKKIILSFDTRLAEMPHNLDRARVDFLKAVAQYLGNPK